MRNKILKSFETFIQSPLSILRNKIINVVGLKTNLTDDKSVAIEVLRNSIQINVVNSDKMYNLLKSVVYKRQMLEKQEEGKEKVEIH